MLVLLNNKSVKYFILKKKTMIYKIKQTNGKEK